MRPPPDLKRPPPLWPGEPLSRTRAESGRPGRLGGRGGGGGARNRSEPRAPADAPVPRPGSSGAAALLASPINGRCAAAAAAAR